ncbi:MAG: cytochrome c maturation protein CcmE [Pseudomonadales bacterium]|nr:cytochrome c maturation protein CcmE [Pseudomonadales bacterium]
MHPVRKKRLLIVLFVFFGLALAVTLTMQALNQNINLFYPPDEMVDGSAPQNIQIRAGGMVKADSLNRLHDSLEVRFTISDLKGSEFPVKYVGILPDMFREGQGVIATGKLLDNGTFEATEVLAKHDENYMPPELQDMVKKNDS